MGSRKVSCGFNALITANIWMLFRYTPALACAPNAPVADCLSMIVHIMIESARHGRRSSSLNLSSLNLGKLIN